MVFLIEIEMVKATIAIRSSPISKAIVLGEFTSLITVLRRALSFDLTKEIKWK